MEKEIRDLHKPEKIEPICNEDLSSENIKKNPILKPIAEINKSYETLELIITRALWEYEKVQEAYNDLIKENSKYSETQIVGKIQALLIYIKQIIHSYDLQFYNLQKTINEMIQIVKKEYAPFNDEFIESEPKIVEQKTEIKPRKTSVDFK